MKYLLVLLVFSSSALAKTTKVAHFVLWQDDETKKTSMAQLKNFGAHLKKCKYELEFCGNDVEVEKIEKVCHQTGQPQPLVKQTHHAAFEQLDFKIPVETEFYKVKLEVRHNALLNTGEIEFLNSEGENLPFGKKAAFFQLFQNCP